MITALSTKTKLGVGAMRADLSLMKRLWEDVDLFSTNPRKLPGQDGQPPPPSASASALQARSLAPRSFVGPRVSSSLRLTLAPPRRRSIRARQRRRHSRAVGAGWWRWRTQPRGG